MARSLLIRAALLVVLLVLLAVDASKKTKKATPAAADESLVAGVRKKVTEHIEADRLVPARKLLKAELQRLRDRAATAAGPGADAAEADSNIPYLRLGQDEAKAAADLLGDLGGVYQRLGQQSEALTVLEESAETLRRVFGDGDPRTGMAADRLADAHVQNGKPSLALPLYRRLLEAMRSGLGTSHPGYQLTLSKMADAAQGAGKPKAAVKAYAQLVELLDSSQQSGAGAGAPSGTATDEDEAAGVGARTRVQYARALASTGSLEEALAQAQKARGAYAARPKLAGSLEHAASLNGVAGILERLSRFDEAVSAMGEAYNLAASLPGVEPEVVQQAKSNLDGLKAHVARRRAREAKSADREL